MDVPPLVRLTRAHLPDVARLHRAAFAGYMNTRLGLGYLQAMLGWFIDGEGAVALVAEDHGRVLGYVVGAPDGYSRALTPRLLLPAAVGLATRPGLLLDPRVRQTATSRLRELFSRRRPATVSTELPDLPPPIMSLVGIGVAPEARGRGVGEALVRGFERESVRGGMRSLHLSVYPDNQGARKLYERCGWAPSGPAEPGRAMGYAKVLAS